MTFCDTVYNFFRDFTYRKSLRPANFSEVIQEIRINGAIFDTRCRF